MTTLGVLAATVGDESTRAVLAGLIDAAAKRSVGVMTFVGGRVGDARNRVYALASKEHLAGLVALSGTIVDEAGADRLAALMEPFGALPTVSVAVPLVGAPCVLVDAGPGLRAALAHLIELHDRQRIAFVCGPAGHDEADRRLRLYEEALADFGLGLNRELIIPGDFTPAGGKRAASALLSRGVRFDAVVVANDAMAIALLDQLAVRGVHVPGDVSVIGFDDVDAARWSSPALTTVRQPFHRQGRIAMELLLDRLEGKTVPARTVMQSQVVPRASCGCVQGRRGASPSRPRPRMLGRAELRGPLVAATHALVDASSHETPDRLIDALLDELFRADATPTHGGFFATLDAILAKQRDPSTLQEVIGAMRRTAVPALEPIAAADCVDILVRAHVLVGVAAERLHAMRRLSAETAAQTLAELAGVLFRAKGADAVRAALERFRPGLPVKQCQLIRRPTAKTLATPAAGEHHVVLAAGEDAVVVVGGDAVHGAFYEALAELLGAAL